MMKKTTPKKSVSSKSTARKPTIRKSPTKTMKGYDVDAYIINLSPEELYRKGEDALKIMLHVTTALREYTFGGRFAPAMKDAKMGEKMKRQSRYFIGELELNEAILKQVVHNIEHPEKAVYPHYDYS